MKNQFLSLALVTIMAISLGCLVSIAKSTHRDFQTVEDLIANIKQESPTDVLYDTNGIIVGVALPPDCGTDHNLQLLGKIKSVKYVCICNGALSTNAISVLAKFPMLTDLRLVCWGSVHAAPALPRLTNLLSLELVQNSYKTNDAIYLAKMTNLMALKILGRIPQTQAELLPLTNLVNLRTLVIWGSDQFISNLHTNTFSKLDKLTNVVITSDPSRLGEDDWKPPAVK